MTARSKFQRFTKNQPQFLSHWN